jgi:hypothetical protein
MYNSMHQNTYPTVCYYQQQQPPPTQSSLPSYNESLILSSTSTQQQQRQATLPSIHSILPPPLPLPQTTITSDAHYSYQQYNNYPLPPPPSSPPPVYTMEYQTPPVTSPPILNNNRRNSPQYHPYTSTHSLRYNYTTNNHQIVLNTNEEQPQQQQQGSEVEDRNPDYTHSITCPTFIITSATTKKPTTRGRKQPTGYNVFYKQEFQRVHKSSPQLQASEVSRLVSSKWREMDKAEKSTYETLSKNSGGIKKKRPLNGYHMFCKEVFARIQQQEPKGDVASWSRTAGAMWKHLSPEDQLWYRQRALNCR